MELVSLPWLLYYQWAYAAWQFIQHYPPIRLLLKLPVWLALYRWRRKRVFLLNEVYEDFSDENHDMSSIDVGAEKHGVRILAREGYWVKAKFFEHDYIILNQHRLAKIWMTDFNHVFVIDKVDITDNLCIARKVSAREAMLKIAGAFRSTEIKATCVYTNELSFDLNVSLAGLIATLPLFLHAKGFVKESAWMSLVILIMDVFRGCLYKLYDCVFGYVSLMVQIHIFKNRSWLYLLFSVFSRRWAYGDRSERCVYNGKDRGFLVHYVAVFSGSNDYELTFGYGTHGSCSPSPEDQHFCIYKKKIYALPMPPHLSSYCKVICRTNAFVVTPHASAHVGRLLAGGHTVVAT